MGLCPKSNILKSVISVPVRESQKGDFRISMRRTDCVASLNFYTLVVL